MLFHRACYFCLALVLVACYTSFYFVKISDIYVPLALPEASYLLPSPSIPISSPVLPFPNLLSVPSLYHCRRPLQPKIEALPPASLADQKRIGSVGPFGLSGLRSARRRVIDLPRIDGDEKVRERVEKLAPPVCPKNVSWAYEKKNRVTFTSLLSTDQDIENNTHLILLDYAEMNYNNYYLNNEKYAMLNGEGHCSCFPNTCGDYINRTMNGLHARYLVLFAVDCALIDYGSMGDVVPGLVVSETVAFSTSAHNRININHPLQGKVVHYPEMASALSFYPGAIQHTIGDELPRILYFDSVLPLQVPLYIGDGALETKYIDALTKLGMLNKERKYVRRVMGEIITASRVYDVGPLMRCKHRQIAFDVPLGFPAHFDPQNKCTNENVFGPVPWLRNKLTNSSRLTRRMIIMDRSDARTRRSNNHHALLERLEKDWGHTWEIRPFVASKFSIEDTIQLFSEAGVVIGVHGAGFSNLLFTPAHAGVVEISYDSTAGMTWPDGFFANYAITLGHYFGTSLGHGSYQGDVTIDVEEVAAIVTRLVRLVEAHIQTK